MKAWCLFLICLSVCFPVLFNCGFRAEAPHQSINQEQLSGNVLVKMKLTPVRNFQRTKLEGVSTANCFFGDSIVRSDRNADVSGRVVALKLENGMTLVVIAESLKDFNNVEAELSKKIAELRQIGVRLFVEEMDMPKVFGHDSGSADKTKASNKTSPVDKTWGDKTWENLGTEKEEKGQE